MATNHVPPHEDPSLPPHLREALEIMARRGPVVELAVGDDGRPVPVAGSATEGAGQ